MKQATRKALIVAMAVGGAALAPMAASAQSNPCYAAVYAIITTIEPMSAQCIATDRQACVSKFLQPGVDFLWDADKDGLLGKAWSALGKISASPPKYSNAARNLDEIEAKVLTLNTPDAKTKLRDVAALAILAVTDAAQVCVANQ